jgi:hypothetical protein
MGKMKDIAIDLQNEQQAYDTMRYVDSLRIKADKLEKLLASLDACITIYNKVDRQDYSSGALLKDIESHIKIYKDICNE